jgi:hypothetical protein
MLTARTLNTSKRLFSVVRRIRQHETATSCVIVPPRLSLCLYNKRNLSTTFVGCNEVNTSGLEEGIADIATVVDCIATEPSFQSLGLGFANGWPPGVLQAVMEQVHLNTGLPWWGTIMASMTF